MARDEQQDPLAPDRTADAPRAVDSDLDLTATVDSATDNARSRSAAPPPAAVPRIEGYQVIGELGAGGVGRVYRAVQLSTRREVALKVLSPQSLGSSQAQVRFDREVELAARLAHPNIVRVFDRGIDRGVCYYAMELVDGVHLDEYVRSQNLSRREILRLIRTVAQAVQHAHQRGVIHRDLKPSNILVTPTGTPCVVDFGLAKALEKEPAGLEITIDGAVTGTPAYMSPEQATGHVEAVDTRSDVFSLGVVLYRLLTGEAPHDLTGTPYDVQRRIAEVEIRPPRTVCAEVDRELEAVLLRALALDPEDRYASAGDLADDLENYLNGEPLTARKATTLYFLGKRLRKHRVGLTLAAAVVLALFGMAVWAHVRVTRQRDRAVAAEARAETERNIARDQRNRAVAVATVLHNLLWAANPTWAPGREVTVRDVLDRASRRIDADLAGKPDVRQQVRDTIGRTYLSLGRFPEAGRELGKVLAYRRRTFGDRDPRTLTAMNNLALCFAELGRAKEAEALYAEAIAAHADPDTPEALAAKGNYASLLYDMGRFGEARKLNREVLDGQRRAFGPWDPRTLLTANNLALCLVELDRPDEAEHLLQRALDGAREELGAEHACVLTIEGNLARPALARGEYADAARRLAEVCRRKERILTLDHPDTLTAMNDWAKALFHQGNYPLAEVLLRRTLRSQVRVIGKKHRDTIRTRSNLGAVLAARGEMDEAATRLAAAADDLRAGYGAQHPDLLTVEHNLARVLAGGGELEAARRKLEELIRRQREILRPQNALRRATLATYAEVLDALDRPDDAAEVRRRIERLGEEGAPRPDGAPAHPAPQGDT